MLYYDQNQLKIIATSCAEKINQIKNGVDFFEEPFKHIVIDGFLPDDLARQCLESFPESGSSDWERADDTDIEVKQRSKWESEFDVPDGILPAIRILNSSIFLRAMSKALDIKKLIPDPYFSGGGLNVTLRGGILDVHVDGNYHDATGLNRRINAICYLNPGWQEGWGGEFGIYDNEGEKCVKKVAPLFNRLVIFDTHDFSYHGLPEPINFPENEPRCSIILYYYTKDERPSHQISVKQPHSALWKKRDFLDKRGDKIREYE